MISIFTSATRPYERGDLYDQALACYKDLADEVVVVGWDWPQEFSWEHIGQTFQQGYERAKGDWVIHMDLDFIFHQRDLGRVKQALKDFPNSPAISFYKWQFILPDRYNLKSRLPLAVNKKVYGDRIKFNGGGDLCQPTLDGKEFNLDEIPQAGVPFYNYEKLIKTKAQVMEDQGRMERAYYRHFKRFQLAQNKTDESAYKGWLKMMIGRFNKPSERIQLEDHPKYIKKTIKNLTTEQWGFSGFNKLEINSYAQGFMRSR